MTRRFKRTGNVFGAVAFGLAVIAATGNLVISAKQKDREELALSATAIVVCGFLAWICIKDAEHGKD